MTETPEIPNQSVPVAVAHHRDQRLHRTLAWVGIVAGVVFTVAVIFFSGLAVGRASGNHGWYGYGHGQTGDRGMDDCPMMRGGPMMGPGPMMDPDDMGPGMPRPGLPPSPVPPPPQR